MSTIIKLDVGGTIFKTSKSTLTKFDGFFKTMLETEIPIAKDESGVIFVDRDPKHFRSILNFMRDGKIVLPSSAEDVKEIQNEAQYYLLEDLVRMCGPLESETPLVESDAQLRRVVNSEQPIIIIRQGAHSACVPIDQEGPQGLLVVTDTIVKTMEEAPQYSETKYCTKETLILKLLNDLADFMIETGRCRAEIGVEIKEELTEIYNAHMGRND